MKSQIINILFCSLFSLSALAAPVSNYLSKEAKEFYKFTQSIKKDNYHYLELDNSVHKLSTIAFQVNGILSGLDKTSVAADMFNNLLDIGNLIEINKDADFKVSVKNKIIQVKMTLDVSVEDIDKVFTYKLNDQEDKSISKISVSIKKSNVTENLSLIKNKEFFKKTRHLVYDNFVKSFRNSYDHGIKEKIDIIKIVPLLREILQENMKEIEYYFNAGRPYTEDQEIAITHVLASGAVAYGITTYGHNWAPADAEFAEKMQYRLLRFVVRPIKSRDHQILRMKERDQECRENTVELKLIDRTLVSAPRDEFCIKKSIGKTSKIENRSYYESSSFYYLEMLNELPAFTTLDGKKITYVFDKTSSKEDPAFILKILE